MIQSVNFKNFRVSEYVQYFVDVCKVYRKNNATELNLEDQVAALEQVNDNLGQAFKKDTGSEITPQLVQLDQERDETLTCISKMGDAYLNHFDADKKLAGQRIVNAIDKYGSRIYAMNYQAETGTIDNVVNDFNTIPELTAAIETLGMNELVTYLKTKNDAFNTKFLDRVSEEAADFSTSAGEIIKEGVVSYRTLVAHTEAHATLQPGAGYDVLINELNVLIEKYNVTVAARGSSNPEDEIM